MIDRSAPAKLEETVSFTVRLGEVDHLSLWNNIITESAIADFVKRVEEKPVPVCTQPIRGGNGAEYLDKVNRYENIQGYLTSVSVDDCGMITGTVSMKQSVLDEHNQESAWRLAGRFAGDRYVAGMDGDNFITKINRIITWDVHHDMNGPAGVPRLDSVADYHLSLLNEGKMTQEEFLRYNGGYFTNSGEASLWITPSMAKHFIPITGTIMVEGLSDFLSEITVLEKDAEK